MCVCVFTYCLKPDHRTQQQYYNYWGRGQRLDRPNWFALQLVVPVACDGSGAFLPRGL